MKPVVWLQSAQRLALILLVIVLAGCNAAGPSTPLPTVALGEGNSPAVTGAPASSSASAVVVASGVAVPNQEATLAFAASGNIQSVSVAVGDAVEAGQVLAALESTEADLALQLAQADVAAAQANYDLAQAVGPAQNAASVAAAALSLEQAQSALDTLVQNAPLETAQAYLALVDAQTSLDEARKVRNGLYYARAAQNVIDDAVERYNDLKKTLDDAEAAYDLVKDLAFGDPARAQALEDLDKAQQDFDDALVNLNWYQGYNGQQLAAADAQVSVAKAQLALTQQKWDEVKDGPSAQALSLAQAKVTSAQAQVDLASAQPAGSDLALAQAQLDAAQARLALSQAQRARQTIVAPFAGVVAAVNITPGEWAMPGQPALVVADLSRLRVETTDLSEKDIPEVAVGQSVTVSFKALNQEASGRVVAISPLADTLGGDIVYKTIIELEAAPAGLRAGMKAEIQFKPNK